MSALRTPVRPDRTALPDRPVLVGVAWRAALVVVAALAVALEAPAWARLPLSAAAGVGVATFVLSRSGRRGVLHVLLVVVGGGLVALALLGLALNALPIGLGPLGWGVAVGVLELAVLAVLALRRAPEAFRPAGDPAAKRRISFRTNPVGFVTGAAAVLVLVGAVVFSTASYDATHVTPLAIGAEPHGGTVTVTVSAGTAQGPFELDLVTTDGRTVVDRDVRIAAGATWTTRIATPDTRAVLQLVEAGSTTPVRQLILDTADAR